MDEQMEEDPWVDQLAAVPGCGRAGHRGDVVGHELQPGQGAKLDCDAQHVARSAVGVDERLISGGEGEVPDQLFPVDVREAPEPLQLLVGEHTVQRTITARGVKQWTA